MWQNVGGDEVGWQREEGERARLLVAGACLLSCFSWAVLHLSLLPCPCLNVCCLDRRCLLLVSLGLGGRSVALQVCAKSTQEFSCASHTLPARMQAHTCKHTCKHTCTAQGHYFQLCPCKPHLPAASLSFTSFLQPALSELRLPDLRMITHTLDVHRFS